MIHDECIKLLGRKVVDKITGASGIVTSVSFDLYGCIQVIVTPGKIGKDGKEIATIGWIDINRLEVKKDKPVMDHPDFESKYQTFDKVNGPACKPVP